MCGLCFVYNFIHRTEQLSGWLSRYKLSASGVNLNIIVFGGSGGIGAAILKQVRLRFPSASVFATWNTQPPADDLPNDGIQWSQVDVSSEQSIQAFSQQFDKVHWLINAVGMLHIDANGDAAKMPEKSLKQLDPEFFTKNMQINALPTLLIAKHFEKVLKHDEPVQFTTVSAKVGSIEDNGLGGWHSYRCSKAALNMAIKNISIEWRRRLPRVCVTALHPGTTNTELSAPFQANVPDGKLFTSEYTASCLVDLLSQFKASDTGRFLAYDGQELPW